LRRLRPLLLVLLALLPAQAALAKLQVGTVAPDALGKSKEGELNLSQFRGRVVVVTFWASWCGPCRQEMPLLEQIQEKYEPLGFTMLGVNVEPDSAEAEKFLKSVQVSFPILFDRENSVSARFGVEAMPSSVLIDREGNVRHVHRGYKPGDEAVYADLIRGLVKE
jgi:thiol-disulfide isomerase/thioredoxin